MSDISSMLKQVVSKDKKQDKTALRAAAMQRRLTPVAKNTTNKMSPEMLKQGISQRGK
jgi:formylglycine-generating enzyme required for sulfatase activity